MDNWHRVDDPECQPPKDGRIVRCVVGGTQVDLYWNNQFQCWMTPAHHIRVPTHWQWQQEIK